MTQTPSQTPLYSIAVAAELAGLTPAALRLYEEKGLFTPARTEGGTRRYSDADVARAREVSRLQAEGVNLFSAGRVIALQEENSALRQQLKNETLPTGSAGSTSPLDDPGSSDEASS